MVLAYKHTLRQWIVLLLALLATTSIFAQQLDFSISQANRQYDQINLKLSTENLNISNLENAVEQLENLQTRANQCITETKSKTEQIDKKLPLVSDELEKIALEQDKNTYARTLAECKLFIIRTNESIEAYNKTIQNLTSTKLFTQTNPNWYFLINPTLLSQQLSTHYQPAVFTSNIGWERINKPALYYGLAGILLLSLIITPIYLRAAKQSALTTINLRNGFLLLLRTRLAWLLIFGLSSLLIFILNWNGHAYTIIELTIYAILGFIIYELLLRCLFYPTSKHPGLLSQAEIGKKLTSRFLTLGIIGLIAIFVYLSLFDQTNIASVRNFFRSVLITAIEISIFRIIWLVNHTPAFRKKYPISSILISLMLTIFLMGVLFIEWLGYQNLSEYIAISILLTLFTLIAALTAMEVISAIFAGLNNKQYTWQIKIHRIFAVKPYRSIPEFHWLKIIAYIIILILTAFMLLKVWGFSSIYANSFHDKIFNGFSISGAEIIPAHILLGALAFCVIGLLARALKGYILRHKKLREAQDTQVAYASIAGYIGFAIALLFGLLIAGINFTGLAIIAGALSVGIGLGLQNIVNNFVSGLILLVERPIKPGDRVIIGDVEGFVHKVRIRSTQITTLMKSDVIVPNSDLITNPVTNYMFRDQVWRVTCNVGVAYGSDIELVRKLLFDIAKSHADVVQEPPNDPQVLFTRFGESSLDFELWCIISDVNKKFKVLSDINFIIDKTFKENGITIAFPQRDLHIKQWPNNPPMEPKQDDKN